jgi:hypothetical protein
MKLAAFALSASLLAAFGAHAGARQATKDVVQGTERDVGAAGRATGHAIANTGRAAGHATLQTGRDIKHGFRHHRRHHVYRHKM